MKGLIFTYLLTYGGAVASLFNPFAGLLIYVCFAIVKPESMWYWSVPAGNYSRIVAIALLVGWAFKGFGTWHFGRAAPIVYALLGFWVLTLAGTLTSLNPSRSSLFLESLTKIVLPFLVGITTIDSLRKVSQLTWVILLSEGYVAFDFNQFYYNGYNRLHEEGFGGMDNNCNAIALVTCVGIGFFLALHSKQWWVKALVFATTALMIHAVLFSFSRGAMITLGVVMFVSFLLIPKQPKHYLLFFLAAALIVRLAGPQVLERLGTAFADAEHRDESASSRLDLWAGCWQIMLENPAGVGPDCFPLVVGRFGFKTGKEAHTLWLQVGAEWGFPGLVLLLFFYISCICRLFSLLFDTSIPAESWYRHFARMVIAALIGFVISAQFVSLKGLEHPFYIVLIGAALLKIRGEAGRNPEAIESGEAREAVMLPDEIPALTQ